MIKTNSEHHGVLAEEYLIWNTPALGAFLFWIFAQAFVKEAVNNCPPSIIHFFMLAGILDDRQLIVYVNNSKKLRTMIAKINAAKDSDIIDALQEGIKDRMEYTSDAVDIAVGCGLLTWDAETARLKPNSVKTPRGFSQYRRSTYTHSLETAAKKLGRWFGNISSITQLATLLKVRL